MKTTTFNLINLTDTDLTELMATCVSELDKRKKVREEKRARWIKETSLMFLGHSNATVVRAGDTIVVAIYSSYYGLRMGKATPVKGDSFDKQTGVAVAFAKACGETIPDYI